MGLPSGYKQLAYIQSSGTQYIDTGFYPNQDTRVVMEGVFPAHTANASLFGARTSSSSNMYTMTWVNASSYFITNYGTGGLNVPFTAGNSFVLDKNKNVTTLNGEVYTADETSFTCTVPLFVFATDNNGSVMHYGSFSLKKMQIYDNGTLVRDFVPCLNSNGVAGLYDLVNGQFYTNAGSGSFNYELSATGGSSTCLIDGTKYEIKGGNCLVDGTGYAIKKGRTLVGGTGYDISFGHVWAKYAVNTEYEAVKTTKSGSVTAGNAQNIYCESELIIENGKFVLSTTYQADTYRNIWSLHPYWSNASANPTRVYICNGVEINLESSYLLDMYYSGYYDVGSATYSQGDYIEDVTSTDENAYPENGAQDGYWYVKIS